MVPFRFKRHYVIIYWFIHPVTRLTQVTTVYSTLNQICEGIIFGFRSKLVPIWFQMEAMYNSKQNKLESIALTACRN